MSKKNPWSGKPSIKEAFVIFPWYWKTERMKDELPALREEVRKRVQSLMSLGYLYHENITRDVFSLRLNSWRRIATVKRKLEDAMEGLDVHVGTRLVFPRITPIDRIPDGLLSSSLDSEID